MARLWQWTKPTWLALVVALGMAVVWALGTLSVASAGPAGQATIPEPTATPTPVIAAVPAASTWALILLGAALAIALAWGVWRVRQARPAS